MSKLNITEYRNQARDLSGHVISAGEEGSLAIQNIVTSASAASSSTFNEATKLVRVIADVDARILFGTAPVADANSTLIPAGGVEYFGVKPGLSLSVIEE